MQQPKELTTKERILEITVNALNKLKWPLLIFGAALALFVVVYLIVGEVRTNRIEKSTIIVEHIENDFFTWLDMEEEEDRQTAGMDLFERLSSGIDSYPKFYAAQRALYIQGHLFFETGAYEPASSSFTEIADRFPKSYLAPVALVNAATALEEAENIDAAIEILVRVTDDFETPEMPAVLFSLGRLSETRLDTDGAVEYYEELLDEYPSSGWTNLAQTRIIAITIDRS